MLRSAQMSSTVSLSPVGRRPSWPLPLIASLRCRLAGWKDSGGSGVVAGGLFVLAGAGGGGQGEGVLPGGGVAGSGVDPGGVNQDQAVIEGASPGVGFTIGVVLGAAVVGAAGAQLAEGDGVAP